MLRQAFVQENVVVIAYARSNIAGNSSERVQVTAPSDSLGPNRQM